jgi:hypothetical protein
VCQAVSQCPFNTYKRDLSYTRRRVITKQKQEWWDAHTHTHTHARARAHTHTHTCTHTHMHTHTRMYTHAHTHARTHAHTHVRTHTRVLAMQHRQPSGVSRTWSASRTEMVNAPDDVSDSRKRKVPLMRVRRTSSASTRLSLPAKYLQPCRASKWRATHVNVRVQL